MDKLFCDYFDEWIDLYKKGAIRDVTLAKYEQSSKWVRKLIPKVKVSELDRKTYQNLINKYAEKHELQTVKDFNTQVKACLSDAVDEGILERDPSRKVVLKGKQASEKKPKYLNQYQLHQLLESFDYGDEPGWEWMILLIAKTGMRFSEALGITPKDFKFNEQTVSINKTWDYKHGGGFIPTKNKSSVRTIRIDWQTVTRFANLVSKLPEDKPIFVHDDTQIYNSTGNDILERYCKRLDIPTITLHGLRHTHASIMLYAGASIASVARRLGHANMTTTQKTYLHIIQELENQDVDVMMRAMSTI